MGKENENSKFFLVMTEIKKRVNFNKPIKLVLYSKNLKFKRSSP